MEAKAKVVALEIDNSLCTGCRACELACSLYLVGRCDPTISRIKIIRDNETGDVFCDLPLSCPECSLEAEPPCVASCGIGALTKKI